MKCLSRPWINSIEWSRLIVRRFVRVSTRRIMTAADRYPARLTAPYLETGLRSRTRTARRW